MISLIMATACPPANSPAANPSDISTPMYPFIVSALIHQRRGSYRVRSTCNVTCVQAPLSRAYLGSSPCQCRCNTSNNSRCASPHSLKLRQSHSTLQEYCSIECVIELCRDCFLSPCLESAPPHVRLLLGLSHCLPARRHPSTSDLSRNRTSHRLQ